MRLLRIWFRRFWACRSYLVSPWKVLFYKKCWLWLSLACVLYLFLPSSIQKPISNGVAWVWAPIKTIGKELGLFSLLSYGIDGVQAGAQWVEGPHAIEGSLGNDFSYGSLPQALDENMEVLMPPVTMDLIVQKPISIRRFQWKSTTWSCFKLDRPQVLDRAWWSSLSSGPSPALLVFARKLHEELQDHETFWVIFGQGSSGEQVVLVVDEYQQELRSIVFEFPSSRSKASKGRIDLYRSSLVDLQERLTLRLLPSLSKTQVKTIEARGENWRW